jgi:hypothetical protein
MGSIWKPYCIIASTLQFVKHSSKTLGLQAQKKYDILVVLRKI